MKGKVVWITGASSGIGLALAKAYSQKGAFLIISARRLELLKELHHYKDENEELIDMFVTERCFAGIRDKIEAKYKKCKKSSSVAPIVEDNSQPKVI